MALDRTWYNTLLDDDGSNTVGTLWNKAAVDSLMDAVDAALALMPGLPGTSAPTTTGTQTALALPTGTGDLVIYANNASLLTVQGIAAGLSGQRLTIVSKGAGQVDFAHLHASGTALGKLKLFATSGLTSLAAGSGVALFQYDATLTQWRLVAHEQGAWITPAFNAADYTGYGAMTWTLTAGDRTLQAYRLSGRTVTVRFDLITTSVGGTLNIVLQIGNGAWGGYSSAGNAWGLCLRSDNGGAPGLAQTGFVGAQIQIYNGVAGNWTASTNLTSVNGTVSFEVT